jgi:hypothetical protein
MSELKFWMKEVEEPFSIVTLSESQDAEETFNDSITTYPWVQMTTLDSVHLDFSPSNGYDGGGDDLPIGEAPIE